METNRYTDTKAAGNEPAAFAFLCTAKKTKKERDVETGIINNQFSNSIFSIHSL